MNYLDPVATYPARSGVHGRWPNAMEGPAAGLQNNRRESKQASENRYFMAQFLVPKIDLTNITFIFAYSHFEHKPQKSSNNSLFTTTKTCLTPKTSRTRNPVALPNEPTSSTAPNPATRNSQQRGIKTTSALQTQTETQRSRQGWPELLRDKKNWRRDV